MRPDLQKAFIDRVSDRSYEHLRSILESTMGVSISYRVCEMPIFVSNEMRTLLEEAAIDIVMQCTTPEMKQLTNATLHDRYRVPNEAPNPLFSVVDFAVTQSANGLWQPRLIELQGFPSLYGYQLLYAETMRNFYGLLDTSSTFSGLSQSEYLMILRNAVFGTHDPAEVALIEIDPDVQKTRTDFICMDQLVGLQTVNIRNLFTIGNHLMARNNDGSTTRLRRVYNRAIIDELDDMGVELAFSWSDDIDVEWAGHPNWYFRMSKFVMPYLSHPSVPRTFFLGEINSIPASLESYVLKPLYAFAGKGVNISPTLADVEAIPVSERSEWILQEKVEYAACVETPFGMNKVEIRVMLIWDNGHSKPVPVMSLARTGRGALMGARYNTEPWTGSTGCLFTL